MENESTYYRVTPESRPEDLNTWSDEELWTLHQRLMSEVGQNIAVVNQIQEIMYQRLELPPEMMGERIELPDGS